MRVLLSFALLLLPLSAQTLPMAVWYGGGKARAPMLEASPKSKKEIWRKDLKQIKALGFNTIRCWIDWASGEPAEGRYNFDTLDVLIELAEQEGLKVFVQVYMDSAPDWVGRKYPDAEFVSSNGQRIQPESSPGYCLDHPAVRKADVAFYNTLATHLAKSPASLGWDLWSEPHVTNWATPTYIYNPEFCFCTNTIARFRLWLKKKYGSLDALNQAWYRRFTAWDQVQPNRLSTILSYTDYIDWKTFIASKLGEDLRARYEAVKRGAPDRVATSHAAGVGLFSSPHYWEGQSDDWNMAKQVDFYGTSFYPKHSYNVDRDVEWRGALLDFTRSFGFANGRSGFYIGELQGGFGTVALNVGTEVTPADLRIWTWSALARGAKGISYYAWYPMSSGYESGGFGLIQLDGTITQRSREAGAIAKVVSRHQKQFLDARPPKAQVAVIYNPLSHFVGGRQRAAFYAGPQGEAAGIERDSLLGIYRALFPSNFPLDFVHINEITAQSLAQYKLVFLPYPLMLPHAAGAKLASFVQNGGALVSEARTGWNDERGYAASVIPGMGLHEVFGCRETAVQSPPGRKTRLRWEDGAELPGVVYEETLEPTSAKSRVVARFPSGAPAAVESSYGKGKTLALGSFLSAPYERERDPALRRFFENLLIWAKVDKPFLVTGEAEVRQLGSFLFAFNHAAKPVNVSIEFKEPRKATDLFTGRPAPLSGVIPPKEVWVLELSSGDTASQTPSSEGSLIFSGSK